DGLYCQKERLFWIASSWPDLHDRVERAVNVGDIFAGIGIVQPFPVHDELVFVPAGWKQQPFFPQPRVRVADHAQAGRMPVIETAADIDVLGSVAFQNKVNLATLLFRSGRFHFRFVFLTLLIFHFWHKQFLFRSGRMYYWRDRSPLPAVVRPS